MTENSAEVSRGTKKISRRDMLKGIAALAAGAMLSACEPDSLSTSPEVAPTPTSTPRKDIPVPTSKEIKATILPPSPTVTPAPTSTETKVPEEKFETKTVDGIETIGFINPMTRGQVEKYVAKENAVPKEMKEGVYYMTFFANESTVKNFPLENDQESLQFFVKRNIDFLNGMFGKASLPGGVVVRRLVIVKDGEYKHDEVYESCYSQGGINDSDGVWDFCGEYKPKEWYGSTDHYKKERVDRGLLHEIGHRVLHLPDHYILDFLNFSVKEKQDLETFSVIADLPKPWWDYNSGIRNDINGGMMRMNYGFSLIDKGRFNIHEIAQLRRRILKGKTHHPDTYRGCINFPGEVPKTVNLSLGSEMSGAEISVYGVASENKPKHIDNVTLAKGEVNSAGEFVLGNPFKDSIVTNKESPDFGLIDPDNGVLMLLLKARTSKGELFFRWMDIRDFNLAYWRGYEDKVTMTMNLASGKDDPAKFDWTIKYS